MEADGRWKQRLDNLGRAVENLKKGIATVDPNDLEKQGIVKAFELTYELAWKTLQDFARVLGYVDIAGPRAAIQEAVRQGWVSRPEVWGRIQETRNRTVHTYDTEILASVAKSIQTEFGSAFEELVIWLRSR